MIEGIYGLYIGSRLLRRDGICEQDKIRLIPFCDFFYDDIVYCDGSPCETLQRIQKTIASLLVQFLIG
jgi:hypothetical protein